MLVVGKEGGREPDLASWCVLGLICWVWGSGQGTKILFHKACSVSPAAGPQESALLPSCPTKSLPSSGTGAPTLEPPALLLQLGESPGQGCPGGADQGRAAVPRVGSRGGIHRPVASGLWLKGRSPVWEGVSRTDSDHIRGGCHRGSRGVGSPEPPSLVQPCPGQPTLGSGPSALAFWAVWPQPWPPCSCSQASATPGAQTPRAISAPELLIFLKRLAALTAMKFFWGRRERGPSQRQGRGKAMGQLSVS